MNQVKVNVYDITGGMARQMSTMIIGKLVQGIWHTSLQVYGNEYEYAGGIQITKAVLKKSKNFATQHSYGKTELDLETFHTILNDLEARFNTYNYDLQKNNCNHFTNECLEILVGKGLPKEILNQAQELLKTPIGKFLKPMVQSQTNNQAMNFK